LETNPITNRPAVESKEVDQDRKDIVDIERGIEFARAIEGEGGKLIIQETQDQIKRSIDAIFAVDLTNPNVSRDTLLNFFLNEISKCKSYIGLLERFGLKIDVGRQASNRQIQRALRKR